MKKSMIAIITVMCVLFGCAAPTEDPTEGVDEGTPSSIAEMPGKYEVLPEAWIEMVTVPYREGSVSFGFEEIPEEGANPYPNYPEGIFYAEPVMYKGNIYIFDELGNALKKYSFNLAYSEYDSYNAYVSGDYLFLNRYQVNLTDGTYEYRNGDIFADGNAVIVKLSTKEWDDYDLSDELEIEVWVDGYVVYTFLVPIEVKDYDTFNVAANPEYLPEQDTLIVYDPAHKYTITLSTGEVQWKYNFPNPPEEHLAFSADRQYIVSRVRYDPKTIGDYFYYYDTVTEDTYPLSVMLNATVKVCDPYIFLYDTAVDFTTGDVIPLSFISQEIGVIHDVAYHADSGHWIRALIPPDMYGASEQERKNATIKLEVSDGAGEVYHLVDTPFHFNYGKMEANNIRLTVYGSQVIMLEWNPEGNLQVLSIACMDIKTGALSRLDGHFFCVHGDYLYITEYDKPDEGNRIHSITVWQYRNNQLTDQKKIEISELYVTDLFDMYYDNATHEIVGCETAYTELFRLSFEEAGE